MMRATQYCFDLIEKAEGFRAQLYNCPAGHCTIGYGHLVHTGPIDGRPGELIYATGVSLSRGVELLHADVSFAEAAVNKLVTVPLNQNQFDALVDFVFNLGEGTLQQSTLLRELNAGDYADVHAQIERFDHAGHKELRALHERRAAEAELFDKEVNNGAQA